VTIGSASHAARSIWRWSSRLRKSWKTQKLGSTGRWANWPRDKRLPTVRGTVGQVLVDHLPDGRKPPKDLWLWHAGPVPAGPDLLWKAYLRLSSFSPNSKTLSANGSSDGYLFRTVSLLGA
jgi:hypothetical protein